MACVRSVHTSCQKSSDRHKTSMYGALCSAFVTASFLSKLIDDGLTFKDKKRGAALPAVSKLINTLAWKQRQLFVNKIYMLIRNKILFILLMLILPDF